jgi:phytoene/squalene synthetase
VPFHAGRRRRFVPDDICRQAALSESALFDGSGGFDGRGGEALARALAALAAAARRHLGQAQADAGAVASEARPLLLFAALTGAYLDRLARRGHDVYAAGVAIPPASKVVRLWWAARGLRNSRPRGA